MKRLAITVHLWLGLTLGALWAVQGLTGAALVFHREIERWANPARAGSEGPMASADALLAAAGAAGGGPVLRLGIAEARGDLLVAAVAAPGGERDVFLDAATARAVDSRVALPDAPGGGATASFLYDLHENLLAGDTGHLIVGLSGGVLVSSLLLGLWIGWPRLWRGVANWRAWRSRPQQLYGWHRLAGLTAGAALVVLVPAGMAMVFGKELRAALPGLVPFESAYRPAPLPAGATPRWIPAQAALERAQARFPGAGFVRLTPPTATAPVYSIRLHQPGEVRAWSGVTTVTVDGQSGALLAAYDPLTAPLANRLLDAAFSIHGGEIAGIAGRLLTLLAGLSLPMFYVTGVWLWWTKRARRPRPALA
ncbi:MAG: PepSY domain-containing protein [Alphaproteobacteria bacterium]|nr:PepSY domain-containing protein [Alphaproteobacteria bacterium]